MSQLLKQQVFPQLSFYSRRTVLNDAFGHSTPHHHDFYEVFIVEAGPIQYHINGRVDTLYPDTLVLVHPADYHCFSRKE